MKPMELKSPYLTYVQAPDAVERLAAALPGKPLLAGGETALAKALPRLKAALRTPYETHVFHGFPNRQSAQEITDALRGSAAIVGVGGGRAIDAAKTAAAQCGLPFYTLPTQAATCAAATRLCVQYLPDGGRALTDNEFLMDAPLRGVYADTRLLRDGPNRYLAAGVADSFAKLSEAYLPELVDHRQTPLWRTGVALCKELTCLLFDASGDALDGDGEALEAVWYANLGLTGLISGLGGDRKGTVWAHAVYDSFCALEPKRRMQWLHGEIVGVGVLMALELVSCPHMPLEKTRRFFEKVLHTPTTLDELGIQGEQAQRRLYQNMLARRGIAEDTLLARLLAQPFPFAKPQ